MSVVSREELQLSVDQVRSVLSVMDAQDDRGIDRVTTDVKMAVDDLRRSVWAVLTTLQVGDAEQYLNDVRIRRAREICQSVLDDVARTTSAAGAEELHQHVRSLRQALAKLK